MWVFLRPCKEYMVFFHHRVRVFNHTVVSHPLPDVFRGELSSPLLLLFPFTSSSSSSSSIVCLLSPVQSPMARVTGIHSRQRSKWRPLPLDTVVLSYYCISTHYPSSSWSHTYYYDIVESSVVFMCRSWRSRPHVN